MSEQREVTIYDIAKTLQISAATVSRGLSNNKLISSKTRKRILDTAQELGYRSNNFASNLRRKKTNTIGVLMHELSSTFMLGVLTGIEKEIALTDYDIIITHSGESGAREIANANNLYHKRVDGLIASLAFDTPNLAHFDQFINKNIPVIFFDRVEENQKGTKIIIDNYKSAYTVTKHLIEQGCKRIAHVTGNLTRNVYDLRYKGFLDALKDYNIKFDPDLLFLTKFERENCLQVANKIMALENRPDGLFVTNDFGAAICIQQFKEQGIKIPDDIAIAGFNNDMVSTIIEPSLTTVNYSGFNMGKKAAQLLIDHLTGDINVASTDTVVLNAELVVRQSTLRKAANR